VMAHAHATDGIKMAIEAGVRSIEHGTFMDTEAMEMMIERDIWWVPTVYIGRYYLEAGTQTGDLDKMMELTRLYQEDSEQRLREGIRRGVKIAVGSDFGGYAQERNVREIETLVDLGMTPMQAIRAATLVGAELLGWEDRVGNLEAGKLADVIAVDGDPLDDIRALRDVRFVMVGGRVARSQPGPRRRPGGRGRGVRRGDLDGLPELDLSAATPRSRRSRGTDPAGRPCSITMPASISRLSRSCSAPTPSRPTTSRRRASSTGSSTTDGTGTVSTTATTSETSVPTATRLPGLRPWASTVPGAKSVWTVRVSTALSLRLFSPTTAEADRS